MLRLVNKSSELRKRLSAECFQKMYTNFMAQADRNAITQKANGAKVPHGIVYGSDDYTIDNGRFLQHFGQGRASQTPYISWHVVSIYYIVNNARIVIGIEKERYQHINQMEPIRFERIGKKRIDIAVFYDAPTATLNFRELYEKFISTAEKVMSLGLQ